MPLSKKQKDLLKAVQWQQVAVVRQLLEKDGINPDFKDPSNTTPLHEACWQENLQIVKLLVSHGAKINRRAKDGKTPLDVARYNNDWRIEDFLKKEGAKRADELAATQDSSEKDQTKPAFEKETLADVFEAGKWVGRVEDMQKLWKKVPADLKEEFDFAAALTEARQKTLKAVRKNTTKIADIKPKPPCP